MPMHMRCQSLEIPDFTTDKTELGLRSFQNAARKGQLPDSMNPLSLSPCRGSSKQICWLHTITCAPLC